MHGLLIAEDYVPYPFGVHRPGDAGRGARLGALFGIFMAGAFVAVSYATINIGANSRWHWRQLSSSSGLSWASWPAWYTNLR